MTTNKHSAKKHNKESHSVKSVEETLPPSISSEDHSSPEASHSPSEPAIQVHPLMAEVESFLSRRDELAQKLAAEIEATEKKLAELKRTADSLFPENTCSSPPDKKSKKLKSKVSNREAKSETASSTESSSAAESAS